MVGLDAEPTLRDLGMCSDIIKAMHRAFTERGQDRGIADYVIDGDTASSPIIGRSPPERSLVGSGQAGATDFIHVDSSVVTFGSVQKG
jgi:type IV secretory pathway VirD2 relaxase